MIVTDKQYSLEKLLVQKLDLMVERSTGKNKSDNVILIDGDEGTGKSNMAMAIAYYYAYKTGRKFDVDDVYFNLEELTTKALNEKEKIYVWDEGALGGLAGDWWNKNQKKFIKLLMVARKRRHFFVICIPKFFKLNEYIVLDRSIGMIHTYLRNGMQHGRFTYYSKAGKERLYYDWRKSKFRNYGKYYTFRGTFPAVLPLIIDEDKYEKKKDIAIMSIDKDDEKKDERSLRKNWQILMTKRMLMLGILPKSDVLKDILGLTVQQARLYTREAKKLLEKESEQPNININSRDIENLDFETPNGDEENKNIFTDDNNESNTPQDLNSDDDSYKDNGSNKEGDI